MSKLSIYRSVWESNIANNKYINTAYLKPILSIKTLETDVLLKAVNPSVL